MSRIWTVPHTWKYKELWTATQLNQELRDNLEFLKIKPRNYVNLDNVTNDQPSLTTSMAAVNDTNWQCSIVTSEANEEVFVYYNAGVTLATGAQYLVLDVLMDNTNYLSSGTGTPLTLGLAIIYQLTAAIVYRGSFRKRVVIPTVGTHTFKLRARVLTTGCVATWQMINTSPEFGVQVE